MLNFIFIRLHLKLFLFEQKAVPFRFVRIISRKQFSTTGD